MRVFLGLQVISNKWVRNLGIYYEIFLLKTIRAVFFFMRIRSQGQKTFNTIVHITYNAIWNTEVDVGIDERLATAI